MTDELEQYDYCLPRELIAQRPVPQRTDARLMIVDREQSTVRHAHVRDLADYLDRGDCLVLNDTRVIPARLVGFRTQTGGRWQGLFLADNGRGCWQILAKTRGRMHIGESVTLVDRAAREDARLRLMARQEGGVWIVTPDPPERAISLLERVGRVPLPHYIRDGEMVEADQENYQTVFARRPGSIAAPTAGLHFTDELFRDLRQRGVDQAWVTLHVGRGTFQTISAARLDDHVMHAEWCQVSAETAARLRATRREGHRVIAVGSTAVRTLETAARRGRIEPFEGSSSLFIRPPYPFHATDGLLTNFHLPRTTLLVLVYTFGGTELMRRAYTEAIRERYRFFSYGDAMLIL